ncbi:competence protein ComFB [Alkalithermobacter thermoalcaliphilus JW-YL-7 = DSM 7308]|uniref:Competence protein ComFB n=1 Tax=Alkalithermobacter thermoalcaliphilus JW-YL-7 = DSM 7308 TaxID=1121328 RepID=A0A150FS30_CLOPD|nr:Late competence development protein ComFB [[Clostridium] paradoxum JW-YL-7 = DSM 7308]SHK33916.1 competence protein ComFB [[Clostridium] paradoxum JW-YL-7 = DSM 7308]
MPKNYMETVVDYLIPSVLKKYENICTCEKCIEDIKAIALNNLPPMYIVTDQGNAYAKLNEMSSQFKANVIQVIVEAIEKVKNNVKHD